MSTAITLLGTGIDDALADRFFARIAALEDVLSCFRPHSDLSRFARGELDYDHVDPAVRLVLDGCAALRELTSGDFDHEPRHGSSRVLDVNALAKGWIVEEAATVLRMTATELLVNAGGDVLAGPRPSGATWRVGIQHPTDRSAILGTFEVACGAVATSGTYERGAHIRTAAGAGLVSVTVVGPDLGHADALATAVFASGLCRPAWWDDVDPAYGVLTLADVDRLRWVPPAAGTGITWHFPAGSAVREQPLTSMTRPRHFR